MRRRCATQGFTLFDIPRERGGGGVHPQTALLTQFLCGYVDCDLRDVAHCGHGAFVLQWGPTELRKRWADRLGAGDMIGFATTERGGSSLRNVRASAEISHERIRIDGTKRFISRLHEADAFIVTCTVGGELVAVLVDADAAGLIRHDRQQSGLSGWSWGDLEMRAVTVPRSQLICGKARGAFEAHFAYYRPMAAALCLGAAAKVLDRVGEDLHRRKDAGEIEDIRSSAAERAGSAYAQILGAFALVGQAVSCPYGSPEAPVVARAAKALAVQTSRDVLEDLALLLGAAGFEASHPVAKARRDVAAFLYADGMHDALLRSVGYEALAAPSRSRSDK